MPQITTYRSVNSLADQHNQVCDKMAELIRDLPALSKQLIEAQTVAGHIYIHITDTLTPDEIAYYTVEKV